MPKLRPFAALLLSLLLPQGTGAQDQCGICPGGNPVQFPDAPFNSSQTCAEVDASLAKEASPETCPLARLDFLFDYPFACGYCDLPPEASTEKCSLCADGSLPARDAKFDPGFGITCGQLAYSALDIDAGNESCTEIQTVYGHTCGCPVDESPGPVCEVCSEGIPEPAKVSPSIGLTCEQLVAQASVFRRDDNECPQFASLSVTECGCAPVGPSDGVPCQVCVGGTPEPAKYSLTANAMCSDIVAQASIFRQDDELCLDFVSLSVLECGCAPVEPSEGAPVEPSEGACTLCAGGVPDPSKVTEDGAACGDIVAAASVLPHGSDRCSYLTWQSVTECGCEFSMPSDAACALCADGSPVPNKDLALDPEDPSEYSCGILELFTALETDETAVKECDAWKATAGAACGCADPPAPACDPQCPPESRFEFSRKVEDWIEPDGDGEPDEILCGELLWEVSAYEEECTENRKALLRENCCAVHGGGVAEEVAGPTKNTPAAEETAEPTKAPTAEETAEPTKAPSPAVGEDSDSPPTTCRIRIGTGQCEALLETVPNEECDCYNFCNGAFAGCCDFGGDCSLTCSESLVAGCTKPDPAAADSSLASSLVGNAGLGGIAGLIFAAAIV